MNNKDIIPDELLNLNTAVANIDRRNVYSVPPGYFSDLAEQVLFNVQHPNPIFYNKCSNPYVVPPGYFEGLAQVIINKVNGDWSTKTDVEKELGEVAPLLNTISKTQVYQVPQGFFETLTSSDSKQAKVVSINKPRSFIKYAAAASITAIMAIGGYLYLSSDQSANYAQSGFNKKEVNKLSDDEIIEYLNNNPSATDVTFTNKQVENEFEKYTKELTEEEIDNYLKETGETSEFDRKNG